MYNSYNRQTYNQNETPNRSLDTHVVSPLRSSHKAEYIPAGFDTGNLHTMPLPTCSLVYRVTCMNVPVHAHHQLIALLFSINFLPPMCS